jgi:hypothetical protein
MDMALYALIMGKLNNKEECVTWNGMRIKVVDVLPDVQVPNTIYFIKSEFVLPETNLLDIEESNNKEETNNNSVEEIATE